MVIEVIVEDKLIISTRKIQKLNKVAYQTIKDLFTYKNPKFIENQKWGYSNHDTPKNLYSYEILDGNMLISRGGKEKLEKQLKKFGIVPRYIDRTLVCETVSFEQSNTILRPDQEECYESMASGEYGVIQCPTSFGKTVTALEYIKRTGQPAMVLTHTTFLQTQWIKEASNPELMNVPLNEIGGVGGSFSGKKRKYGKLNICLYHSMAKKEHLDFFRDRVGVVIMDECLDEDTYITTPKGHTKLKYLKIGDYVIAPNGKPVKVVNKWCSKKEAFEYILKDKNSIIASKDHKVKGFSFRWEKVREFKHGEFEVKPISEQKNISVFNVPTLPENFNSLEECDMHRFTGWFLADGTVDAPYYVKFGFTKRDKIKAFKDFIQKTDIPIMTEERCSRGDTTFKFKLEMLPNYFSDKSLKSYNKKIPHNLFLSCDIDILKGLFDGDGSFTNTYIEYDTTSFELGSQVSSMLRSLGIQSSSYEVIKKNPKAKNQYRIIIMGADIERFDILIGFRVKNKNDALKKYLPRIRFDKPVRDIISSKSVGVRNLIDIEIDSEDHLFIANGLVVSNCQKAPIEAVQNVINKTRARYRWGLSAMPKRKDGKEFLTFDSFGPIRHIAPEEESDSKILSQINLVPSPYQDLEDDGQYTNMITRMASDKDRNVLICKRALAKIKEGKLVLIFVERKFQAAIIAKYLSKYRVDMLLGPTNWKDYSIPHLKEKFKQTTDNTKRKAIVSKLDQAQKLSPKMLEIIKDYDAKTAYERIEKVAMVKELDVIIGTQKAEVGLSIRTIDHIIVTTPAGNNAERFKQIIGRGERTYKQKEIDYFGCEKERPTVDVIVDAGVPSSRNAKDNIKEIYGKRVKTIRRRRK